MESHRVASWVPKSIWPAAGAAKLVETKIKIVVTKFSYHPGSGWGAVTNLVHRDGAIGAIHGRPVRPHVEPQQMLNDQGQDAAVFEAPVATRVSSAKYLRRARVSLGENEDLV